MASTYYLPDLQTLNCSIFTKGPFSPKEYWSMLLKSMYSKLPLSAGFYVLEGHGHIWESIKILFLIQTKIIYKIICLVVVCQSCVSELWESLRLISQSLTAMGLYLVAHYNYMQSFKNKQKPGCWAPSPGIHFIHLGWGLGLRCFKASWMNLICTGFFIFKCYLLFVFFNNGV